MAKTYDAGSLDFDEVVSQIFSNAWSGGKLKVGAKATLPKESAVPSDPIPIKISVMGEYGKDTITTYHADISNPTWKEDFVNNTLGYHAEDQLQNYVIPKDDEHYNLIVNHPRANIQYKLKHIFDDQTSFDTQSPNSIENSIWKLTRDLEIDPKATSEEKSELSKVWSKHCQKISQKIEQDGHVLQNEHIFDHNLSCHTSIPQWVDDFKDHLYSQAAEKIGSKMSELLTLSEWYKNDSKILSGQEVHPMVHHSATKVIGKHLNNEEVYSFSKFKNSVNGECLHEPSDNSEIEPITKLINESIARWANDENGRAIECRDRLIDDLKCDNERDKKIIQTNISTLKESVDRDEIKDLLAEDLVDHFKKDQVLGMSISGMFGFGKKKKKKTDEADGESKDDSSSTPKKEGKLKKLFKKGAAAAGKKVKKIRNERQEIKDATTIAKNKAKLEMAERKQEEHKKKREAKVNTRIGAKNKKPMTSKKDISYSFSSSDDEGLCISAEESFSYSSEKEESKKKEESESADDSNTEMSSSGSNEEGDEEEEEEEEAKKVNCHVNRPAEMTEEKRKKQIEEEEEEEEEEEINPEPIDARYNRAAVQKQSNKTPEGALLNRKKGIVHYPPSDMPAPIRPKNIISKKLSNFFSVESDVELDNIAQKQNCNHSFEFTKMIATKIGEKAQGTSMVYCCPSVKSFISSSLKHSTLSTDAFEKNRGIYSFSMPTDDLMSNINAGSTIKGKFEYGPVSGRIRLTQPTGGIVQKDVNTAVFHNGRGDLYLFTN
jgi:hypothetical protein